MIAQLGDLLKEGDKILVNDRFVDETPFHYTVVTVVTRLSTGMQETNLGGYRFGPDRKH